MQSSTNTRVGRPPALLHRFSPGLSTTLYTFQMLACLWAVPPRPSPRRYTGEDGFEISVPSTHAVALAEKLIANERVRLAGEWRPSRGVGTSGEGGCGVADQC